MSPQDCRIVISSPRADHQSRVDECFRVSSSESSLLHEVYIVFAHKLVQRRAGVTSKLNHHDQSGIRCLPHYRQLDDFSTDNESPGSNADAKLGQKWLAVRTTLTECNIT